MQHKNILMQTIAARKSVEVCQHNCQLQSSDKNTKDINQLQMGECKCNNSREITPTSLVICKLYATTFPTNQAIFFYLKFNLFILLDAVSIQDASCENLMRSFYYFSALIWMFYRVCFIYYRLYSKCYCHIFMKKFDWL